MKEKIYTIPVNEAFDENTECAICYMREKLETEAVDYALGGAMMEPDYRIISNKKGYCNRHYAMMLPKKEKLSLALVLETHLKEVRDKITSLEDAILSLKEEKTGIFKKTKADGAQTISDTITEVTDSCVICEKLDSTMERYLSVVFYLWEKEDDFRKKLINSKGFCLPHFDTLVNGAFKYLGKKKAMEFLEVIHKKEVEALERLNTEVHDFTLMFDYRNAGKKWGSEVDAPKRCCEKLSGYIVKE